jgi:hypothetical protein
VPNTVSPEFMQQWFLPVFVVGWIAVCGLLARLSGWTILAQRFGADGPMEGERFRFASGSLGREIFPVSYGHCLFVTVGSQGLGISLFLPFRVLSPPLVIPWAEVESMTEGRILFFDVVVLAVRDSWVRLSLRGAAGRAAKAVFRAARGTMP